MSEDFSTTTNKGSGELIWNLDIKALHPPMQISDYTNNLGNTTTFVTFDVGTGEDGVFDSTTYSKFSKNADLSNNTIRFDTASFTVLQVTDFNLSAGWTLQPVGDNPLIIKSQGQVIVEGVIQCSGEKGQSFQFIENQALGGTGRCGGGSGGAGVYRASDASYVEGQSGTFLGTNVVAGRPSVGMPASNDGVGSGGGGGGAYSKSVTANVAEAGTAVLTGLGGVRGEVEPDHQFKKMGGGAGGGGGDARSASNLSGAGGGAGGGVVVIYAYQDIKVYPSGGIYANGGQGGGNAVENSGAGGGGGGGSIQLFAGGDVYLSGAVQAYAGAGGVNSTGTNGGRGGLGRTWVAGKSGYSVALAPNALVAEKPDTLLADVGKARYQTGSFVMTSDTLDTSSTKPDIKSATLTTSLSSGDSASIELAFGDSVGFAPDSWTNSSSLTGAQKRYLRFRAQITNSDAINGAFLQNLTVAYEPYYREEFEFNQNGGCGVVRPSDNHHMGPPSARSLALLLMLLMLPLGLALKLKTQS